MDQTTRTVQVELGNGKTMLVEAVFTSGEAEIADSSVSFEGVLDAIEGLSQSIASVLEKVKPRKAMVEFGLQTSLEAGRLTALLVKGTGTASIKVTLEWGS
jgi:hypothetical protein